MRMRLVALAGLLLAATACTTSSGPPPNAERAWQRLPDAPTPRTEVAAAALGNRIVVAGGYRADGATVATVDIYSIDSGSWRRAPDLPLAVNHAMAATAGGSVYVFGGYRGDNTAS